MHKNKEIVFSTVSAVCKDMRHFGKDLLPKLIATSYEIPKDCLFMGCLSSLVITDTAYHSLTP